jgi:hypothetical protein
MAHYRANPLPWCTWGPESGAHLAPFAAARYTALNRSSMAGGKYQFLPSTWHALGGYGYAHQARPVTQERLARKLYRRAGTSPWVGC